MRRDLGGELLVAVAVVGVFAFALIFGITLSLSNQSTTVETPTVEQTDEVEVVAQALDPTVVDSPTVASTATERALTVIPTFTQTGTPTGVVVPREPTATRTFPIPWTPTPSATDTAAVVTPSATPTITSTSTPTETEAPPAAPTLTAIPPTLTDSPTALSPTPSHTPTTSPTSTHAAPTLNAPTTLPGVCLAPSEWGTYAVRAGDTLYAIARAYGTSVGALRMFNCISVDRVPSAGDRLRVPAEPLYPVATVLPLIPPAGQSYSVQGCTNSDAAITNLVPGQEISGVISVEGAAVLPDFASFRLEVRPLTSDSFDLYVVSTDARSGSLGQVNTADYGIGLHTIRLVVARQGTTAVETCAIPVIFR